MVLCLIFYFTRHAELTRVFCFCFLLKFLAAFFLSALLSRGAWRRLNDIEIVCDALSSGINEPAYNLSFKFWRDLVVGLSIGIP